MNRTQTAIYNELRNVARATSYSLSHVVDAPQASVRRVIGELRRLGHTIEYYDGLYSLRVPAVAASAPTTVEEEQ